MNPGASESLIAAKTALDSVLEAHADMHLLKERLATANIELARAYRRRAFERLDAAKKSRQPDVKAKIPELDFDALLRSLEERVRCLLSLISPRRKYAWISHKACLKECG